MVASTVVQMWREVHGGATVKCFPWFKPMKTTMVTTINPILITYI